MFVQCWFGGRRDGRKAAPARNLGEIGSYIYTLISCHSQATVGANVKNSVKRLSFRDVVEADYQLGNLSYEY